MLAFLLSMADSEEGQAKIKYMYKEFHDVMIKHARTMLRDAHYASYETESEDIVQEAFMRMMTYVEHIDISLGYNSNKAYALMITTNVINSMLKKTVFCVNYEECENFFDNEAMFFEALNIKNRYDEVMDAIDRLDDIYKMVFILRYEQEKSVKEIAMLLGIPEKTVYTQLLRGRKLLWEMIDKEKRS